MGSNYKGLFEGWEIAVAKKIINEFRKNSPALQKEGFEDLLQECLVHWFFVKDGYDLSPESRPQSIMAKIIRNKLTDIIRSKLYDHLTPSSRG